MKPNLIEKYILPCKFTGKLKLDSGWGPKTELFAVRLDKLGITIRSEEVISNLDEVFGAALIGTVLAQPACTATKVDERYYKIDIDGENVHHLMSLLTAFKSNGLCKDFECSLECVDGPLHKLEITPKENVCCISVIQGKLKPSFEDHEIIGGFCYGE